MKNFLPLFIIILLVFIVSCNNSNGNETQDALSDSTSVTGLTGDSVKLVKTASINFKVKDVEQSTRTISSLAQKFGGMIYNKSVESVEGGRNELRVSSDSLLVITSYSPQANVTARIPSQNLEEFMYEVADLGYFTANSKLNIDDKSLAYLENGLKQKNRTDALKQVNKTTKAVKTNIIGIKDEAIEQQIANKSIDADVKYSTVNLTLFQNSLVRKEIVANTDTQDYELPFGKRFSNAISNGWQYFINFVLVIVNLWMFILVGVLIFLSYNNFQKRKVISLNMKR